MSSLFPLKPTHKPVKAYYAALAQFQKHGHTTEGNTRSAFADLLKKCASPYGWHLVEEYQFKGTNKQPLRADGALIDDLTLQHGLWEAKDTNDDLKKEIKAKFAKGYVKAFRWASDRIKSHGIVCFVTNNSFIDQIAFDGMRKHLARDFTKLYIVDLGGNVRHNPSLSGTTHNVFGIQVGVAISILVKQDIAYPSHIGQLHFVEMDKFWKKEEKYAQLTEWSVKTIEAVCRVVS